MTREIAPPHILNEMERIEIAAFTAMYLNRPDEAKRIFKEELEKLYKYQQEKQMEIRNFTVHKGGPLHNIGIALAMQNNLKEAARFILAAYMEDLFTLEPEEAKNSPAYKFLYQHEWLRETIHRVTQYAIGLKEQGKIPFNPLEELIIEDTPEGPIGRPKKTLKGTPENRVFIGGNYKNIALLREIADIVYDLKMIPILVADYCPPDAEDVREVSLDILNKCQWAFFEISFPNGHMMEIEHVLANSNWKLILLLQIDPTFSESRLPPSKMLPESYIKRYESLDQLKEILQDWFRA